MATDWDRDKGDRNSDEGRIIPDRDRAEKWNPPTSDRPLTEDWPSPGINPPNPWPEDSDE